MLDFRIETFLTLCEELNYTKAARRLCITQPAVSQHIRYLEEMYGVKLFRYRSKRLSLTAQGELLRKFALLSKADWNRLTQELKNHREKRHFSFGATLTIGEYVMPDILEKLLEQLPDTTLTMIVSNTETLLQKLQRGKIDFAFVEGPFDKGQYATALFCPARFIPVCSPCHPFAGREISFDEIFTQRLIAREAGSGTRSVLEQVLLEHSQTVQNFADIIEIGNLNVIKKLVSRDKGITFLYEKAAEQELRNGTLKKIRLRSFDAVREFNFVCLADSRYAREYFDFLALCKSLLKQSPSPKTKAEAEIP